jgi:hypothetical protein
MSDWIDEEFSDGAFADKRLDKRFRVILEQLSDGVGTSIPFACQDWATTKAAYRFLSNYNVNERAILDCHFEASRHRFAATSGPVLVLHDTTEFNFHRTKPELIGKTKVVNAGHYSKERPIPHTLCGILMHSSLAVTPEGLPLGLGAIKFWTRKEFKGANALSKKINRTRVPIEQKESVRWLENIEESTELFSNPDRCVHIGDRESDIFELFCLTAQLGTHFVIRTCVNRLAGDGKHTVADEIKETRLKRVYRLQVFNRKRRPSIAVLEIKYRRINILPPIGKQNRYPSLCLTVLHAVERGTPKDRDPINWKLITDLPVRNRQEAIEKLNWYSRRWKIETFHKIIKSGCKAEASKLRTAERLVNLLSIFCILAWRIFWMTMLNREAANLSPHLALTKTETTILDAAVRDPAAVTSHHVNKNLSWYLTKIARMGGYLARKNDPPPGNMVMWRGITRLTDIEFGFLLGAKFVGN